jgi:hypothetical protein
MQRVTAVAARPFHTCATCILIFDSHKISCREGCASLKTGVGRRDLLTEVFSYLHTPDSVHHLLAIGLKFTLAERGRHIAATHCKSENEICLVSVFTAVAAPPLPLELYRLCKFQHYTQHSKVATGAHQVVQRQVCHRITQNRLLDKHNIAASGADFLDCLQDVVAFLPQYPIHLRVVIHHHIVLHVCLGRTYTELQPPGADSPQIENGMYCSLIECC